MCKFNEIIIKIIHKPMHLFLFGLAVLISILFKNWALSIALIPIGLGLAEITERSLNCLNLKKNVKKELFNLNLKEKDLLKNSEKTFYLIPDVFDSEEDKTPILTGLHNKNILILGGMNNNIIIGVPVLSDNTPVVITDTA